MANAPEKKFRAGVISATIWDNVSKTKDGKDINFKTIQLDRRYQDKDGNWKSSSGLRLNDLPKAIVVMQEAYKYLIMTEGKSTSTPESNNAGYEYSEEYVM